eukprot:scaffold48_cov311-Pinguiococcus_pyrenoidosus.AAC.246
MPVSLVSKRRKRERDWETSKNANLSGVSTRFPSGYFTRCACAFSLGALSLPKRYRTSGGEICGVVTAECAALPFRKSKRVEVGVHGRDEWQR